MQNKIMMPAVSLVLALSMSLGVVLPNVVNPVAVTCPEHYVEQGDTCVAVWEDDGLVLGPLVSTPAPEPMEDDPAFDCRIHGNSECGVLIEDTWYIIAFEDGSPASVRVRG